jgi:superfamily II DNA or RNA helicase
MNLYSHQQKIIDEDPKKCGLFLGTGSGKTRIALLLARGRTLVVCPKTQREDGNWERELFNLTTPQEKFLKFVKDESRLPIRLTVISKETFRRDHATLPAFDTVIVDEAHTVLGVTPNTRHRNKKEIPKASQLFEALESYLERTKPERLYLATATIMKSPFTVWAAMKLLGKRDGSMQDFFAFRQKFYSRLPMPGREVWVPKSDKATKDDLAYYVRATGYVGRLQDFFDVPDQTFRTEHIELTAAQKARIKELPMEYPEPIVRIGKRHQVENGVLAGDEFSEGEIFPNKKVERIIELAEEFPRMVIFAKYRAQIAALKRSLEIEGYKVLTLTGDTKDRGLLLAEANKVSQCIFIAQAQISAGWELPEYPVMVFASRTYSFVDYSQAQGRILRANALKKNLYINLVVKGGVDEAVDRSLINKCDFSERVYAGI